MIFSPFELNGRILVDGGIINPIPIAPTLKDDTHLTIAVALNGLPEAQNSVKDIELNENNDERKNKYQVAIEKFIDGLLPKNINSNKEEESLFNLVIQSMDTMRNTLARFKLSANPPDIIIEIPRNLCSWFEFDRAEELIEFGYARANETLKKFDQTLEKRK